MSSIKYHVKIGEIKKAGSRCDIKVKTLCSVFSQDLLPFQAEGEPLAILLIAVGHALLETVRVTFSALNTSNQGRHVKVILFFSIRPYLDGCCR